MYCNVEPDLVLLDVMMPGIDGFEVCRRLREGPRGERLPIIMLTGLEDTSSIERAYDEGATDFIQTDQLDAAASPRPLRAALRKPAR